MPKRHRFGHSGEFLQNAVGFSKGAAEETSSMESIPEFRLRKGAIREGLRPVEAVAGDFIVNSVSQKPRDESAVPKQFPWTGQSGHDSQGSVGPDERFFRLDDNDRVDSTDIQSVALQQGPGEIGLDGSEVEQPLRIVPQYPTDPDVAQGAMSVVENDRVVHGPSSLRLPDDSVPGPVDLAWRLIHIRLGWKSPWRLSPYVLSHGINYAVKDQTVCSNEPLSPVHGRSDLILWGP